MEKLPIDRKKVKGIIMILTCQKYKVSRIKRFKLPKDEYEGWKIIYILGNLFLEKDYELENNILKIKTEDSYLHLFKKVVLGEKYLDEIFDIEEGILKVDDDIILNEKNLINFLNSDKKEFIGKIKSKKDIINFDKNLLKKNYKNNFMINYYFKKDEEFKNKYNGMQNLNKIKLRKYNIYNYYADKIGTTGGIYYISKKCYKILINFMEKINFDIFYFDNMSKSYPFLIEDGGTSFILLMSNINMYHNGNMYSDINEENKLSLGYHTNLFKTKKNKINLEILNKINNII